MAVYNINEKRLKNDLDVFKRYCPKTLKSVGIGTQFAEYDANTQTIIDPTTGLALSKEEIDNGSI